MTKTRLPDTPSGLAAAPDGQTYYFTVGTAEGRLVAFDVAAGAFLSEMPAGHHPTAPVVSSKRKRPSG